MTLTLSIRLHPGCRVDSISKQTVSGHFQPHHAGTHWACKTNTKYSQIFTKEKQSSYLRSWEALSLPHLRGNVKYEDRGVSERKLL